MIGAALGGELLGATLYELPPGQRTWPFHFEHGNEEWLLCVAELARDAFHERWAARAQRRLQPAVEADSALGAPTSSRTLVVARQFA